jgi:hypothetical protein
MNRPPDLDRERKEHIVQFYSDDDLMLGVCADILGSAIRSGDAAICVATTDHRKDLEQRFKLHGQNLTDAIETGRFIFLDATDALSAVLPEWGFDAARASELFGSAIAKVRAAATRNNPRVALVGEMVALLWSNGRHDDVVEWEHSCNDLGNGCGMSVYCGYPMEAFKHERDRGYFQMICAEHSVVTLPAGLPLFHREDSAAPAEGELDEVRSQAEQLIRGEVRLDYPQWQRHYQSALLETDRNKLFKQVEIAEAALLTWIQTLPAGGENVAERHDLMKAWSGLQMIKKEKLAFGWNTSENRR